MAGLIGVGQQYKNESKQGLQTVSNLSQGREIAGDNLEQAEKSQKMSAVGMGASVGMMAGMQAGATVGGPWGAAIGAGIGLIASELF